MNRVIIESPYRGETREQKLKNKIYLQECINDSLRRGEAPFASHQMYTDALDDNVPNQRTWGVYAGYEWWDAANKIVFYVDYGWSTGMRWARERAKARGRQVEERRIHEDN